MRTTIRIGIIVIVSMGWLACDKSPTEPSPPVAAPPVTAAPVLTSLNINSKTSGTAIGETVQLTAMAVFSDKTTKNVTSEAVWTSLDPSVVTVSAAGVVTIVGFGVSNITAQYQSLNVTREFRARPTSGFLPFHVSGVATDDEGRPVAGARVLLNYTFNPDAIRNYTETMTDAQGRYEADFEAKLATYHRGSTAQVSIISDGHERDDRWFRPSSNDPGQTLDLHPRVIRWIPVGEPVSVTVWDDGAPCINNGQDMPDYSVHYVCRKVRLVVPTDGVLTATAVSANPGVHVLVEMEGPGILDCCYQDNPISMTVRAGMVVSISVEILEGVPSQTITLTTTIR